MFTPAHIEHLRELVARADQDLARAEQQYTAAQQYAAGWRELLRYAEANTTAYPGDARVYPPNGNPLAGGLTPNQERAFAQYEAAHAELAEAERGGQP